MTNDETSRALVVIVDDSVSLQLACQFLFHIFTGLVPIHGLKLSCIMLSTQKKVKIFSLLST